MDARSTPERIGEAHLADQLPNFERHLWPAGPSARFPTPERAKPSSMPADDSFWLYDRKDVENVRRNSKESDEDQAIEPTEDRTLRSPKRAAASRCDRLITDCLFRRSTH